jgi:hypothetical protein
MGQVGLWVRVSKTVGGGFLGMHENQQNKALAAGASSSSGTHHTEGPAHKYPTKGSLLAVAWMKAPLFSSRW